MLDLHSGETAQFYNLTFVTSEWGSHGENVVTVCPATISAFSAVDIYHIVGYIAGPMKLGKRNFPGS